MKPKYTKATLKKVDTIMKYIDDSDVFEAFMERIGGHHVIPTWQACIDYCEGNLATDPFKAVVSYAERTYQISEILALIDDGDIEDRWYERCKPEPLDSRGIKSLICDLVDVSMWSDDDKILQAVKEYIQ